MPKRVKGEMKWHALLLSNPQVSWYENIARRGRNVADIWLRNIARNLDAALGKGPADLLAMTQPELEQAVSACIEDMFERDLLGSTVQSFMTALSSFLAWHDREINWHPGRVHPAPQPPGVRQGAQKGWAFEPSITTLIASALGKI